MLKLGLTGGIASGKSTIGKMFQALGAYIIETDHLSRVAVEPPSNLLNQIAEIFGNDLLDDQGQLRRMRLREIIFSDEGARAKLNSILHPEIGRLLDIELKQIASQDKNDIVLVDVPLLFETSWQKEFSAVILVYVPKNIQILRLMQRDGVDLAMAAKSLAAQMPLEEKRKLAQYIIDNSGLLEEVRPQVKNVWQQIKLLKKTCTP